MKKEVSEINFCNLTERTEENWGCAFATNLIKERMNAAREYGRLCWEDDGVQAHKHAIDFECGAMWGEQTVKRMTIRWMNENFPKTAKELKNLNWEEFIDKYLYDIQ